MNANPMLPSATLLIKLGSLARHGQELAADLKAGRAPQDADLAAIDGLVNDPDIVAWMGTMDAAALLPVMR